MHTAKALVMQGYNTKLEKFSVNTLFDQFLGHWHALQTQLNSAYVDNKVIVDDTGDEITNIPVYIHKQLTDFFENQSESAQSIASGRQMTVFKRLQYMQVSLVDEFILTNEKWDIAQQWMSQMLELYFFKSRRSGDLLIQHIEEIPALNRPLTADEQELALCYLKALWLGFKGKYHSDTEALESLTKRLVAGAQLRQIDLKNARMCEQAYQYNISPVEASRLAPISKWIRYSVLFVIGHIFVSTVFWLIFTFELAGELQ